MSDLNQLSGHQLSGNQMSGNQMSGGVPKVQVDFDKCASNGLCEALAPKVFYLDDDDFLQFHKQELDEADLEPVRRAVASCPTAAISIVEG